MLVVVTLACVVLGVVMGRMEYLRRMALFHDGQSRTSKSMADVLDHASAAKAYREASKRPWLPVQVPRLSEDMRREMDRSYTILPKSSAPAPTPPKK